MSTPLPRFDFTAQWLHYRRANWAAGLWLVVGLPAVVLVAIGLKVVAGIQEPTFTLLPLTLLWAVGFYLLSRRVTRFLCPRCESLYFAHKTVAFGQGRQCANCELPLYSSSEQ